MADKSLLIPIPVLVLAAIFMLPSSALAGSDGSSPFPLVSVGLGIEYLSGDYGTDTRTDFVSLPLYLDFYPSDRFDFELIVPLVYQSNRGGSSATLPYRTPQGSAAAAGPSVRAAASGPGGRMSTTASSSDSAETGLGDISFSAGFVLVPETQRIPQVRVSLYVKSPTADEEKGLGTGEWDWGPGLGISKWIGNLQLFTEGRYIDQGESDLYATQDYLSYNGGVGYQLSPPFYGALQVRGATESSEGISDYLEARVKFVWRFLPDTSLEGGIGRGLTDSSPDLSASLALFFDL